MQATNMPVAVGDILAGKYRVQRVLGAGGMGIVVAAEHIQLRQVVAIKFVLPNALGGTEAVERFLREARAVVRLRSEHVARVIDVGSLENGAPYMVMEFLEGSTLDQILEHGAPLPIETVANVVIQACEALAEAHSLGIVHRDLKPQNLFLTQTVGGTPLLKVLDFGVSKMESVMGTRGLTQTAALMGSPLYMAPEQMRSARSATARSDIWALGVVLYQLLTDHVPFSAETLPELCLKVALEPALPLRTLRPDVPPALEAVVMRCLEKDHARRFANAAELAMALEPFAPAASGAAVERARLIVKGVRPSEIADTMTSDPLLGPSTPEPAMAPMVRSNAVRAREPKTGTHRVLFGIVAGLALAFGAFAALLVYVAQEDEPGRSPVGAPATLDSANVRFTASSATAKGQSPSPPMWGAPDAARPFAPHSRPPPPAHADDIPTMR